MLSTDALLSLIRERRPMTLRQQVQLVVWLSVPAILAQLSSIAMQYVDAAMVGSLGAEPAAAVGLVSTTTWLFWGMLSAAATGFSVQAAHLFGSGDTGRLRQVFRQGFTATLVFSSVIALVGAAISPFLPAWLGGDASIHRDATLYFLIFSLFLPALQLNYLLGGMLRCSGNMRVPSAAGVLMCLLDVVYNFFLIFPTRDVSLLGLPLTLPGAGLGVLGAALGTVLAELSSMLLLLCYVWRRRTVFAFTFGGGGFLPRRDTLVNAFKIGLPMGVEHVVICSAQILSTVIVAPLGVAAIAANSFAITAESLCYMPGYGIAEAATTLVGQSMGAGRRRLMRSFANITVLSGMAIMGVMGVVMYAFAPEIMVTMTPVREIRELGSSVLRIEAFAEPMFAAAIVAYGVFVGTGRTLVPSLMNFASIWAVRLTLAAWLATTMGLRGVWTAMCIELCFRGAIFLFRLWGTDWARMKEGKA